MNSQDGNAGNSDSPPPGDPEPETRVEIEKLDQPARTAVVVLGGYLYLSEAKKLTEEVETLILTGVKNLIIEMQDVCYMNSSAIAALSNCAASVSGGGGRAILTALNPTIEKVLETLGLLGMFTTARSREEALEMLS